MTEQLSLSLTGYVICKYFPPSCGLPFHCLLVAFDAQKFLILIKSNLALFSIVIYAFDVKQDSIALSKVMKVSCYVLL